MSNTNTNNNSANANNNLAAKLTHLIAHFAATRIRVSVSGPITMEITEEQAMKLCIAHPESSLTRLGNTYTYVIKVK